MAVDARSKPFKDSEGEFCRKTDCVAITANGRGVFVTASGKRLGEFSLVALGKNSLVSTQKAFKTWNALPEEERKPGSATIGEQGEVDSRRAAQQPPKNVLILRVFNRQLMREDKDGWRYTRPEDYVEKDRFPAPRYAEPANDSMWITEAEWKSMVPANPEKGTKLKMPEAIALRFFRFQLEPARGLAEGGGWPEDAVRTGQMALTIEDVTPQTVKLRLNGSVRLTRKTAGKDGKPMTYKPSLLGYLTWDSKAEKFTRFDVVALGDIEGPPSDARGQREGAQPLGIAFELVTNPTPADLLHPRGLRDGPERYFGTTKGGKK